MKNETIKIMDRIIVVEIFDEREDLTVGNGIIQRELTKERLINWGFMI